MDVTSEQTYADVASPARHEASTNDGDPMQIDSEDASARTSVKLIHTSRASNGLTASGAESQYPQSAKKSIRIAVFRRFGRQGSRRSDGASTIHHLHRRPSKWPGKDLERMRKRQFARVTFLCHKLLGHDPLNTFAKNCEKVIADWNSLLSKTILPNNTSSSDPQCGLLMKQPGERYRSIRPAR